MNELDRIDKTILDALAKHPAGEVLTILTGHFVGLVVEVLRRSGNTPDGEIHIDGGKRRDITIHAVKGGSK